MQKSEKNQNYDLILIDNENNDTNNDVYNNDESEKYYIKDPVYTRSIQIIESLDDKQLVSQLLLYGIEGKKKLPDYMKTILKEYPPSGIILFKYNIDDDNKTAKSFLKETALVISEKSGISPFMAVDHEGGTVNRMPDKAAEMPNASFYWNYSKENGHEQAIIKIEADSFRAGTVISNLGINLNIAPVAEYLNDDNSTFLQYRSYGQDPQFTADAAEAFIRGMKRAGVLCVIKHFPGSAGLDPHYYVSVLNWDKAVIHRLVSPFASLINNGARAVMVAHSLIPSMDNRIASLSQVIMKDWLRGELGFNGIIISDDFAMSSSTMSSFPTSSSSTSSSSTSNAKLKTEEAAVMSIAAGSDMVIVWPADIKKTNQALIAALNDGRLTHERLKDAAAHIIYEKLLMGIIIEK